MFRAAEIQIIVALLVSSSRDTSCTFVQSATRRREEPGANVVTHGVFSSRGRKKGNFMSPWLLEADLVQSTDKARARYASNHIR